MNLIRIDKLFDFEKGSVQSSKCIPGNYHFLTASAEWKTHNEFTHNTEALVFAAAASGSLGRTHYINDKFIASDLCFILTPKDPATFPIDLQFYHIIFNELKEDIVKNTKSGTSKEAIGLASFGKYELPYFDLGKQTEIKNRFVSSEVIKENISTELSNQLSFLKKLRQQILQDAVQGKLVPQDPNDEPASILLQRIKAEKEKLIRDKKIKKEKSLPPIKPEEIPFEIPENWVWCRLGEISLYSESGKSYKALATPAMKGEWGVIKTSAMTSTIFNEFENKKLPIQKNIYDKILIKDGDLLFCRASGSKELAGKSCVVLNKPIANLILSDKSVRYIFPENIVIQFIQHYNNSIFAQLYFSQLRTGKSTSMNNIIREQFDDLIIPLPSYFMQQYIVTKIEQLMKLCDELEQAIQQNQKYTQELLQVALREALEAKVSN